MRVIAATNRDLRDFVRDGKFREDLYYRLSVFELVHSAAARAGHGYRAAAGLLPAAFQSSAWPAGLTLTSEARTKLLGYQWPGNVRQLRNVIDSAVVMSEGNVIQPADLGLRDASGSNELESLQIE